MVTEPLPALPADILVPGARVSHYEIKSVVGSGGMGIVYRAADLKLDRDVAIKCIRPDRAAEPDFCRRIEREARAASRLSHPGIVRVLDVLEVNGLPAIVMDLVEGSNLRSVLATRGALPLEELLAYGEDLAAALGAAHSRGILHRDVNPNNVLITADGRALLADFGLARCGPRPSEEGPAAIDTTQSAPGLVLGTVGYMSPEQLLGRALDQRTDIFALGTVIYEMATGAKAFHFSGGTEAIDATLNREPPPMARFNPAIPEELDRIVRKAMAKRADERYHDARELQVDLRALRRRSSSGITVADVTVTLPKRRQRLLLTGVALATAVVGLALWRTVARLDAPPPLPECEPRQLTSSQGLETEPALSPDGTMVAYASNQTGNFDIWVVDIASGRTLQLTDDPASDRLPAWFPDGSAIAFVSDRSGTTGIWTTTRLGGPAVLLAPDASDPAIAPDRTRICFVRSSRSGDRLSLWIAPLQEISQAHELSGSTGIWDIRHPAWSPDGTTICYEDFDGLWLIPAAGGSATRLAPTIEDTDSPVWSPSGRYIYCSEYDPPSRMLWRISVPSGAAQRISLAAGEGGEPSVAGDGRYLAYSTLSMDRRVVLLDLASGTGVPMPFIRSPISPVLDHDGARIWFLAAPQGLLDVWSVTLSGGRVAGDPRQVTSLGDLGTFAVSPDGRFLAYHRNVSGQRDIWISSAAGGPPTRLVDSPTVEAGPSWSPDGTRLAFLSEQNGHSDMCVMPMVNGRSAGQLTRIALGVRASPDVSWSPASDALAYVGGAGSSCDLWVVPADGRGGPRRVTSGARLKSLCWGSAADEVYASGSWGTSRIEVRAVRLATGDALALTPPVVLGDESCDGKFLISRTGRQATFVEEQRRGHIWVAEATTGRF